MTDTKAYCGELQLYPQKGVAYNHLKDLINAINGFEFFFQVKNHESNQGQLTSNFDEEFRQAIIDHGGSAFKLPIPDDVPQKLDFSFQYNGKKIAVEVEKANREKFLRDMLKAHMYLSFKADFSIIALPRNYPHSSGIWNLFDFGCQRYEECRKYGFGTKNLLDRILVLGFTQFNATTRKPLDTAWRKSIRNHM